MMGLIQENQVGGHAVSSKHVSSTYVTNLLADEWTNMTLPAINGRVTLFFAYIS